MEGQSERFYHNHAGASLCTKVEGGEAAATGQKEAPELVRVGG